MAEPYPCSADVVIAGYHLTFDGTVNVDTYSRLSADVRKRGIGGEVSVTATSVDPGGSELEIGVEKAGVGAVIDARVAAVPPGSNGLTVAVEKAGVGAVVAATATFEDIPDAALTFDVEKSGIQGSVRVAASYYMPPPPTGDVYNAVTQGGCANNGSTDDLSKLQTAATAAKAAGLPLYLPAGTGYKLSAAWTLPTNITILGDGITSHVLGEMRMNTGCNVRDLFVGVSTGKGLGFNNTTTVLTNMAFTRCRFRGGQSASVFSQTTAYQHFNGLTFTDCTFEVAYFNSFTALGHSVALQTDRGGSSGQLMTNLTFDHCLFGAENEYGQTENKYGSILFYSHSSNGFLMTSTNYCDNLTVKNCIFEKAWNWGVDYAMNDGERHYDDSYCGFTCTDNLFKGGGGHRAEASEDYPIGLDLEPVYHGVITGNVFMRHEYESMRLTYDTNYCTVANNTFDYRVVNGITPYTSTSYNYWVYRVVNFSSGTGNSATGNKLYLPTTHPGTTPSNNGSWIANSATGTTISGNYVYKNDNTPPDYETIMDVGPRG